MTREFSPLGANGFFAALFEPVVKLFDRRLSGNLDADPFHRDPQFIARCLPLLRVLASYYSCEIRGWENVPQKGPMLIVGNHSGGAETSDMFPLLLRWAEQRGIGTPLYALAYDLMFGYPMIGPALRLLGAIPANQANGRAALRAGAAVLVFPGGDFEVFRPWRDRNRIDFHGHDGFVRLALQTGVPVVPMTIHGAHQSTFVITRGRRIARAAGLNQLHIKVFPFIWNIPLGITPAFVPTLQLPSKITVEFGKPLDWSRLGTGAARRPRLRRQCYDEIVAVMQETMDRLAAERPFPVLDRLDELLPLRVLSPLAAALASGFSGAGAAPPSPASAPALRRRGGTSSARDAAPASPRRRTRRRTARQTLDRSLRPARAGRASRPNPS
jgi:1-acyl-sn-glycerol-3-phosphate acyltransferase